MAIGIVSDVDFEAEMNSKKVPIDKKPEVIIEEIRNKGRGDNNNTPEVIREIVGEEKARGASVAQLMQEFALSESAVKAYGNGATSTATYDQPHAPLVKHLDKVRDKIKRKATNRLIYALDVITPESLAQVKPQVASAVAKDMAAVIKTMEPENENNDNQKAQFVVYAPQLTIEQDYRVVKVQDP
jgi:hypothetical protein